MQNDIENKKIVDVVVGQVSLSASTGRAESRFIDIVCIVSQENHHFKASLLECILKG